MVTNEAEENGQVGMKYLYVQRIIIFIFPVSSDPEVLFIYRILVHSGEEQTFPSTSPLQL